LALSIKRLLLLGTKIRLLNILTLGSTFKIIVSVAR
jgi:hypothetical protein